MLVKTKLFVPTSRTRRLSRPRLLERLEAATASGVTLISAPAGFGKSTLVADWASTGVAPLAWLSLEPGDNDPHRFWVYVLAALETVTPAARPILESLQSTDPPPLQAALSELVNALTISAEPVCLALDDLHAIDNPAIHADVVFLIEHLPPAMGLIATTRSDPPWPLARWRARGRLTEVRAQDLRFTADETRDFFLEVSELSLSDGDIAAMATRTEGWIAGLHMAALSMAGRSDIAAFIRDFSGSHRFILDYLADEVLTRQSPTTRRFLLQTSILDRMCAPLCDAVTESSESVEVIAELEAHNLFVIPLDEARCWYRYHHLFRDYLRAQLRAQASSELLGLHRRAAAWFADDGYDEEAIAHALAGEDYERAADLIEGIAESRFTVQHQVNTHAWLEQLPTELVARRPALCTARAFAAFVIGKWHEAQVLIDAAEETAGTTGIAPSLWVIRAFLHFEFGRMSECVGDVDRLFEVVGEPSPQVEGLARLASGGALLHLGRLDDVRAGCERVLELGRTGADPVNVQVALSLLTQTAALCGDLREAERLHRQAMSLAGEEESPAMLASAITRVAFGEALREWNHLDEAERTLRVAMDHCRRQLGLPEHVLTGGYNLARTLWASGDEDGARAAFDSAEQVVAEGVAGRPLFERLAWPGLVYRARFWLESGHPERAEEWATRSLATAPSSVHRRILELVLARAAIARGDRERARSWLDAAAGAPEQEPRSVAEHAWLSSVLARLDGDEERAAAHARAAREVGVRQGYERLFSEERSLATASRPTAAPPAAAMPDGQSTATETDLLDPLNDRERSLLRLMDAGLTNAEIAGELYLSIHTVKWHARNLFSKLGVKNRTSALSRARELGLV